jgi:hypothetical protein
MMSDETMPVKIFLKNGQSKTGMLLDGLQPWLSATKVFKFISNSNYANFQNTQNNNLIEYLTEHQVANVDTFLK